MRKRCPKCNSLLYNDEKTCPYCGTSLEKEPEIIDITPEEDSKKESEDSQEQHEHIHDDGQEVTCPRCGSNKISFVSVSTGPDYSAMGGCCGYIVFGPLGLLCGLTNKNKTRIVRKCLNCGNEF